MPNQPAPGSRGHYISSIPDPLWEQAQTVAAERGESVSAAIRRALEEYVSRANVICRLTTPHCADCGSVHLHEGPNDPPPWCCCEDCGSCDVGDPEQCLTNHAAQKESTT
jgi:hypothetical protein